jgi:hypothetical protein
MPGERISQVHGTARPAPASTGARAATAYAMYHPAAALRQASLVITLQRDMASIPETLLHARAARLAADEGAEPAAPSVTRVGVVPPAADVLSDLPAMPPPPRPGDDQLGLF